MSVTEEDGQAPVGLVAMGDLSSDFSVIVMAINGTAIGKSGNENHRSVEIRMHNIRRLLCVVLSLFNTTVCFSFSENSDFTGNMWIVNFPAGAIEAGFMIPIIQDSIPEDTEEFSLKIVIEAPLDQRVTVGEPSVQQVLITGVCAILCLELSQSL